MINFIILKGSVYEDIIILVYLPNNKASSTIEEESKQFMTTVEDINNFLLVIDKSIRCQITKDVEDQKHYFSQHVNYS